MAGYACPHCGQTSDPFGSGGVEDAAGELGVAFLGRLPLSLAIRSASDDGNPPAAGESAEAQLFAALAKQVLGALDTVAR
jgi:ATP-binding protein involved in chromosome partitioning